MSFCRKPFLLLALVAVIALVVPSVAADEATPNPVEKFVGDTKQVLETAGGKLKEAYDGLSPETKKNIAVAQKTIADTVETVQEKLASTINQTVIEENLKAFKVQANEFIESVKNPKKD